MKTIDTVLYTFDAINSIDYAEHFFKKLEDLFIVPNYVSQIEPINIPYTKEKAIELWSKEEKGCWDQKQNKFVGKAGGMLGKNRDYSILYNSMWWKCPDRKKINLISINISIAKYSEEKNAIYELFRYLIGITNVIYGYIAHSDTIKRQHGTGGIEHRIPGIFWCNYFSNIYINFFGREKFNVKNWYKTESVDNKGIIVFIDEHPYKRILENVIIEEKAKMFLGYDSFANPLEEEIRRQDIYKWANEDPTQYKNVPKLI
jgi:hypothetical protein